MFFAPRGFPLLKQLVPPPVRRVNAYQILRRDVGAIQSLLNQSYRRGLLNREQVEDVTKELKSVLDVLADLSQREARVKQSLGESSLSQVPLKDVSDTSLRFLLDKSYREVSLYLCQLEELLQRLLAYRHIPSGTYQALVRYFDRLREIHATVVRYASQLC